MNKRILISIVLLVLVLGCLSSEQTLSIEDVDEEAYPLTLHDNQGINVTILEEPKRIISIAPSNTEILYAIGASEKIIAVTEYDNYPPEVVGMETIGGFSTVNIERVVSMEPDLVFATGGVQTEIVKQLRKLGLVVAVIDAEDIDGILENIVVVGRISGHQEEANRLVLDLEKRVEEVRAVTTSTETKPRVMYIVWGDPLMSAGQGTFIDNIIELAGGENIFQDTNIEYPKVSMESVLEKDPELIIMGDHGGISIGEMKTNPQWMETTAVKTNSVYEIDGDIVSRQGPRIVDALTQFSAWISGNTSE